MFSKNKLKAAADTEIAVWYLIAKLPHLELS